MDDSWADPARLLSLVNRPISESLQQEMGQITTQSATIRRRPDQLRQYSYPDPGVGDLAHIRRITNRCHQANVGAEAIGATFVAASCGALPAYNVPAVIRFGPHFSLAALAKFAHATA
jgi:hypothetical protein